jgi:hypothetical protein
MISFKRIAAFGLLFLIAPLLFSGLKAEEVSLYVKEVAISPYKTHGFEVISVHRLSAKDDRFGGFSGLAKSKTGYISVTDRGQMVLFDKTFKKARFYPLREKSDDPLSGKDNTDAEGISLSSDQTIWISFERNHRITPYNEAGYVRGKDLNIGSWALGHNQGLEAIEQLQDGRFVVLAEGKTDDQKSRLWVQVGSGWKEVLIHQRDGFRPTGLTRIPDTDQLVLLERFYAPMQGVRLRLSLLNEKTYQRERLLGELAPPIPVDNFEGISAEKNAKGQTILTLISDDNFSILQRTLIMKLVMK